MKIRLITLFLTVLGFISACTSLSPRPNPGDGSAGAESVFGTRVALLEGDDCSVPAERGIGAIVFPLATAVAPELVDQGLGWLHTFFSTEAEEFNASADSQTAGLFYQLQQRGNAVVFSPQYSCIAVAHGALRNGENSGELQGNYPRQLSLAARPSFYLEASFAFHDEADTVYFRLVPTRLEFNEPLASHGQTKDLIVTYSFTFPTVKSVGGDGVSFSLAFPAFQNLRAGTVLSRAAMDSVSSAWSPLPIPQPSEGGLKKIKGRLTRGSVRLTPLSVLATLTETDQGRGAELFLKLAGAIEHSKGAITEALTERLKAVNSDNK